MKIRKFNESISNEIFLSDIDEKIRDMFQEFEDLDLDYTIKTGMYNGDNSKNFSFHNNDLRVLRLDDGTYVSYLIDIKISDDQSFIDIKDNKAVDVISILKNKQEYYDEFKFYMSFTNTGIKVYILTNIKIMDRITTNKFKSLAKEFGCPCKVISSYSAKFDDFFLSKLEDHFKKFAESRDGKDFKDLYLSDFEVEELDNKRFTILKIKNKS